MPNSDPLVMLEELARQARRETAPETRVPLPALLACRREQAVAHPAMMSLLWPAVVAGLTAAVVLLLSLHTGHQNFAGNTPANIEANQAHPTQVALARHLSDSIDPLFAPLRMDLP